MQLGEQVECQLSIDRNLSDLCRNIPPEICCFCLLWVVAKLEEAPPPPAFPVPEPPGTGSEMLKMSKIIHKRQGFSLIAHCCEISTPHRIFHRPECSAAPATVSNLVSTWCGKFGMAFVRTDLPRNRPHWPPAGTHPLAHPPTHARALAGQLIPLRRGVLRPPPRAPMRISELGYTLECCNKMIM